MKSWIFRFVSILGERYTHGHVFDFYKKLLANPKRLPVLGNGLQRKSYLYIQDCIDAIFHAMTHTTESVNIFNLGTKEYCQVNDSIGWITDHLGVSPKLEYSGGERGWVGDNPFIYLDTARIRTLGWSPKLNIREGIGRTLAWLIENRWVLDRRT
jgi:UDP-glucose 4-epimerase